MTDRSSMSPELQEGWRRVDKAMERWRAANESIAHWLDGLGERAPLEVPSYADPSLTVVTGQGDGFVLIQIVASGQLRAAIMLRPDDAEAFAWSLMKRAQYAREPE